MTRQPPFRLALLLIVPSVGVALAIALGSGCGSGGLFGSGGQCPCGGEPPCEAPASVMLHVTNVPAGPGSSAVACADAPIAGSVSRDSTCASGFSYRYTPHCEGDSLTQCCDNGDSGAEDAGAEDAGPEDAGAKDAGAETGRGDAG